jgi:hypothetical protein
MMQENDPTEILGNKIDLCKREDLLIRLESVVDIKVFESDLIQSMGFDHSSFVSSASEQSILVHRASKKDFSNLCAFWLSSLFSQDWKDREGFFLPYARQSLCLELGLQRFNELIVEYSAMLIMPNELPLMKSTEFQGALTMFDAWNDVAFVAQSKVGFVAFYWNTTA